MCDALVGEGEAVDHGVEQRLRELQLAVDAELLHCGGSELRHQDVGQGLDGRLARDQADRGSATCGQKRSAIFARARERAFVRLKTLPSI